MTIGLEIIKKFNNLYTLIVQTLNDDPDKFDDKQWLDETILPLLIDLFKFMIIQIQNNTMVVADPDEMFSDLMNIDFIARSFESKQFIWDEVSNVFYTILEIEEFPENFFYALIDLVKAIPFEYDVTVNKIKAEVFR